MSMITELLRAMQGQEDEQRKTAFNPYGRKPPVYGGEIDQQPGAVPEPSMVSQIPAASLPGVQGQPPDAAAYQRPQPPAPPPGPVFPGMNVPGMSTPPPAQQPRSSVLPKTRAANTGQVSNTTTAGSGGGQAAPAAPVAGQGSRNWQQEQDDAYAQSDAFRRQSVEALQPKAADLQQFQGTGNLNQIAAMRMMALGGDEMQGMGGQVLKQAMDQQGKGQIDPMRMAELKAKKLETEAAVWERRATLSTTRQDREIALAQAERLHQESIAQRRETARMHAASMAATRAATNAARDDRVSAAQTKIKFDQGMKLSKEYDSRIKNFDTGRHSAETLQQLASQPDASSNAASQVAMVFAFGKMLDPTSVVREGEYRLFEQSRGLLDSWGITPERIRSGVRLTPSQIKQMAGIAETVSQSAVERQQALKNYYAEKGSRWNIDPTDIMPDYSPYSAVPKAPGSSSSIDVGSKLGADKAPKRRSDDRIQLDF